MANGSIEQLYRCARTLPIRSLRHRGHKGSMAPTGSEPSSDMRYPLAHCSLGDCMLPAVVEEHDAFLGAESMGAVGRPGETAQSVWRMKVSSGKMALEHSVQIHTCRSIGHLGGGN